MYRTHVMVVGRVDVEIPVVSAAAGAVDVFENQPDAPLHPLGELVTVVHCVALAAILVQGAVHHRMVCNGVRT